MRIATVPVIAVVLCATACSSGPRQYTPEQDEQFVTAVREVQTDLGITYDSTPAHDGLIATAGHMTCDLLDEGSTPAEVRGQAISSADPVFGAALYNLAVTIYCPEYA